MVNLMQEAGMNLNLPQVSGGLMANFALYAIGVILGLALLGLGTYLFIRFRKYNKFIHIFGKVNGTIVPIGKDRAMAQRVGLAGDYWFRTMKNKKILPRPTKCMGKNIFWFFIREDGEWINFSLADIDAIMKEAGVYYVDEDMRMQRLAIEKNLRDRYSEKPSFWAKYGGLIINIFFVLIVMVALILLFKEMGGLADKLGSVATSVEKLADATSNMISRAGSGVIPA